MWVRGLKPFRFEVKSEEGNVAPYVGAWIETITQRSGKHYDDVAPYVGAWIETILICVIKLMQLGRTLCGCVD